MTVLTLDDVSARIKQICADHMANAVRAKDQYDAALEALARDVDASPNLNKDAVATIVFGQVRTMMSDIQGAVG